MSSAILIGIGAKPKPTTPQLPQSRRWVGGNSQSQNGMPAGGSGTSALTDPAVSPSTDPAATGAKASRDEAGFIPAGQCCGACEYFTKETGDCAKVEGTMQAHDACKQYFEAANGDQSGPSDTDDMGMMPGMQAASQSPGAGALRGV
jgi:hypothetical protein